MSGEDGAMADGVPEHSARSTQAETERRPEFPDWHDARDLVRRKPRELGGDRDRRGMTDDNRRS